MRLRPKIVVAHRWAGLAMTVFLIIVGLTGGLLAFYSELDRLLNPSLYPAPRPGVARLQIAELVDRAETIVPDMEANSVYLREPERAEIRMRPRALAADASSKESDFDTLLLDPYTGSELGRYEWGNIRQGRVNLMPFIYRLHYELALGRLGGWALGLVALGWTLDCFIGLYLTFPASMWGGGIRHAISAMYDWRQSWRVKWRGGAYRIAFDTHRAGGLWLWAALLIFAWSGVYMNFGDTVYFQVTRRLFDYHPTWEALEKRVSSDRRLSWSAAEAALRRLAIEQSRSFDTEAFEPTSMRYSSDGNVFSLQFRSSRDIQDRRGVTEVIADGATGELVAFSLPTGRYMGNTITSWLYALHMANVFGLPYRFFVCALGVVVPTLALSGLVIWLRKQHARRERRLRETISFVHEKRTHA